MMGSDLRGRVCVVTGATAGIGKETARGLARMGATVALVARSRERGEAALASIRGAVPGADVCLLMADLSRQADVRRLADEVLARFPAVHVLVNDAATHGWRRRESTDGVEMQLAVNHLAPYLLTRLLVDRLAASAPARIVTVSSAAHERGRIRWKDIQARRGIYRGFRRYCDTKLMNLLFTRELARRLNGTGVTANAVHPGAVATELLLNGLPLLKLVKHRMKTPEQGARASLHVASSPSVEGVTGRYFVDEHEATPAPQALSDDDARRLWEVSAGLVGLD
jgi:NAD(P)-dependent dehydrogenase (short-subunit alcohol dehydrogenase family)